ncbi:MAG: hypothetical protein ACOCRK_02215 [bacterium]
MIENKEIRQDVEREFLKMLGDYAKELKEKAIQAAINDVIECSALVDEGYYNDSDVTLACQRTIINYLNENDD